MKPKLVEYFSIYFNFPLLDLTQPTDFILIPEQTDFKTSYKNSRAIRKEAAGLFYEMELLEKNNKIYIKNLVAILGTANFTKKHIKLDYFNSDKKNKPIGESLWNKFCLNKEFELDKTLYESIIRYMWFSQSKVPADDPNYYQTTHKQERSFKFHWSLEEYIANNLEVFL